jgi:dolichyl-phosphate-mannose-protein mannosyltransferase
VISKLSEWLTHPAKRVVFGRFSSLIVVAIAALARLYNLSYPKQLVFDETYYVKDAWSLSHLGYESTWPAEADAQFVAGHVNIFEKFPSFVVHPPLGKWLISLGMNLFGAQNSWSWRIVGAVLGIVAVYLLILIARILFKSYLWGAVAGFLFAIDGHAIVLARTALLDNFLMFFLVLAFWFLLKDRQQEIKRVEAGAPALFFRRPWLLAVGLALGCATSVKWSGIYFVAIFGVYTVVSETLRNREHQLGGFSLKQSIANFVLLVPTALTVYLLSWTGWLVTRDGYDRQSSTNPFIALFNYHRDAFNFHVSLHTPHSYASNPLTWLFAIRPTSFYYVGLATGQEGCTDTTGCSSAITALGNPLIWWAAGAAVLWLFYRYIITRDSSMGLILLGMAAGYLPWLGFMNRTVFQFYAIAFEPWMILALVYALAHHIRKETGYYRYKASLRVMVYLGLTLAVSIFFIPIWFGTWTPYWFWLIHMWIPSWI